MIVDGHSVGGEPQRRRENFEVLGVEFSKSRVLHFAHGPKKESGIRKKIE